MTEPYVHASGDGPPAVLVHGTFVGGPQSFAAQAPLAEDHRLLIVDRRGYGANPAQGETLGWPVDSEDLLRLLEELGGAHLAGHSWEPVVRRATRLVAIPQSLIHVGGARSPHGPQSA
jgi:pimeloyl-ACP methyl ester carboxylesterase